MSTLKISLSETLFAVGVAFYASIESAVVGLEEAIGAGEAVCIGSVEWKASIAGGGLCQIERAIQTIFGALVLHDGYISEIEFLGLVVAECYFERVIGSNFSFTHPIDNEWQHEKLQLSVVYISKGSFAVIQIGCVPHTGIDVEDEVGFVQ